MATARQGSSAKGYQLHVWLREISPMIWRRLPVQADSTIADLHYILQIAFGWTNSHLHSFRIHGKDYGVSKDGGVWFSDDPDQLRLADFCFHRNERFLYVYDLGDYWEHVVRVERALVLSPSRAYPVCIGGSGADPIEDCGGPWALQRHRSQAPFDAAEVLDETEEWCASPEGLDDLRDRLGEHLAGIQAWLRRDRFDRRKVNRRLRQYGLGDEAWRWP